MSQTFDRRSLLVTAGAGAVTLLGACATQPQRKVAPRATGRKLRHGAIACGGMGFSDLRALASHPEIEVVRDALEKEAAESGVSQAGKLRTTLVSKLEGGDDLFDDPGVQHLLLQYQLCSAVGQESEGSIPEALLNNRPLLKNGDKRATLERLVAERYPTYEEADFTVESGNESPDVTVNKVLDILRSRESEAPPEHLRSDTAAE